MSAYGGAAGYRPRVQSAYYMRVYRHIRLPGRVDMGVTGEFCKRFGLFHLSCTGTPGGVT